MMMFNAETNEIAKPSELLNSVKAIMSVLQSIENYGKEEDCWVKWMSGFYASAPRQQRRHVFFFFCLQW